MASSQTSYRVESFTGITVDNSYSIYFVSTGLTVEKMWWNGSQFVDADLMASSQSGLTVQPWSQVTVDAGYNIYYVSAAQAIRQMSWPTGATKFADVSINASQPVEPETSVTVDVAGSVYYVDTSKTVHKMYITGGQWVDANLMASTQSGSVVVPGGGVAVDGSANVYYDDPFQTIHEMYWVGTHFADANLMASSQSGMHVSVAFIISGQVTNGGAGLNGVTVTLSGTTASGATVSQTTTTATVAGIIGEYAFLVADGGNYTVTPSLSGYTFSPPSQSLGNVSGNQSPGPFQDVPLPLCASATNIASPITAGTSQVVSVTLSSAASATVTFAITGAITNAYSNSLTATQVGKSTTYQATLNTGGLLGEYKVVPLANNVACSESATAFFNVTSGTNPSQPAAVNCSSMTGTWTDAAAPYSNLTWSIQNSGGTISGTATAQDSCGNQITWAAEGNYNAANQEYTLTGNGASPTSCLSTPFDQIVTGKLNAGSCGLGSGSFQAGPHIVSSPPGMVEASGSNTLTVSERIPNGESTAATSSSSDWLDQYGAVTTAQFSMKLSSASGYNFGGRTVIETAGTTAQGSDSCTYQGAPWPKLLTLKSGSAWNVQNDGQNGSYGPDLVGLSADQVAYIQAFSGLSPAGCQVTYPQIMKINEETSTGNEAYGSINSGDNTLKFSVTPTNITVTRGNASVTRAFHF